MRARAGAVTPRRPPGARAIAAVAAIAALAALLAWQWRLAGDFRIDDAYIGFSFAKNLGSGRGLVYSWGERVEGYSNFLWVALCSLAYAFGGDDPPVYPFARALAWGSFALLLAATWRLARRREGPAAALGAVALLAATTDFARAAASGLETVPYAALVTAGAAHYLGEPPGRPRRSLWWFVAAALVRIDGFVPLLFVLAFEAASARLARRLDARAYARWALAPLAAYALYFAARWAYYGLPLPSTYYAKSMVTEGDPYRGYRYLWLALHDSGAYVSLAVGALALRRPSREAAFAAAFVAYYAAYVVATGGDWMPFNRFALPLFPFVFALFVWGAADALRAAAAHPPQARRSAAVLVAAAFLFVAIRVEGHFVDTRAEAKKRGIARFVARHTHDDLLASVPWVRQIVRAPGETLVTDYAGAFAVYTDARIIDMWGLCNVEIARRGNAEGVAPVYGKTCLPCYREFDPDYFHVNVPILRPAGAFDSHQAVIDAVFQGPALDRHIDLKGRYATGRVREAATGRSLYFLERRREGRPLRARPGAPGFVVEYPFEPGGAGLGPVGRRGPSPDGT
jgi:arabinofuranosyltransferase